MIEADLCDYVVIVPAWGGAYKERAMVSIRHDMMEALTKVVPDQTIRGYSVVEARDDTIEFVGLIGSDTALNLAVPSSTEEEEANRKKRLQVFMRGVSIPERYAKTTIGSIMALPVSRFIVALRDGDDLSPLNDRVGHRPILGVYRDDLASHASSTLLKQRLKNSEPIDDLVDPQVLAIIRQHGLYQ